MGTNYYLEWGQCEHCGLGGHRLHIGKGSSGFHGYLPGDPSLPEWQQGRGILNLPAWGGVIADVIDLEAGRVVDEYDDVVTLWRDVLTLIGKGASQLAYFREHGAENPAHGYVVFAELPRPRLAKWDEHRNLHAFWEADGYCFSTGEWS